MQDMRIIVEDIEKIQTNTPIWSVLCIEADDLYFPSRKWSDATSSVLVMWMDSLKKMVSGNSQRETLLFMDGDFSIKIVSASCNEAQIVFCEQNRNVIFDTYIDLIYFSKQVLLACHKVIKYYEYDDSVYAVRELRIAAQLLKNAIRGL